MLNVVRGRTKPFDLFYVESTAMKPRVGLLSLCYGIVADIDIESEKFRCMGEARFTFYALQRIACLRTYRAKLWYLPASDYSELVSLIYLGVFRGARYLTGENQRWDC